MSVDESEIESVFEDVVYDVLQSETIDATTRKEINGGFCSIVATEVYERLGKPNQVQLCVDTNQRHYWIELDGLYFDAERTEGVDDWRNLPYWKRHKIPSEGFSYGLWVKHTGF